MDRVGAALDCVGVRSQVWRVSGCPAAGVTRTPRAGWGGRRVLKQFRGLMGGELCDYDWMTCVRRGRGEKTDRRKTAEGSLSSQSYGLAESLSEANERGR